MFNAGIKVFAKKGWKHEHGVDISTIYESNSISIGEFSTSLKHDTRLMRESKGTPKQANIFGYVYDIDTGELSLMVEDKGEQPINQVRRTEATIEG